MAIRAIEQQVKDLMEKEGTLLMQTGRVLRPGRPGLSFADRVETCDVSKIRSGDVLLDDEERWWHLRRPE